MRYVKVIFGFILVLLGIIFIIENLPVLQHAVTIKLDLYFLKVESAPIPLWVMVLFSFFLGVFTAFLYFFMEHFRQRQTIRQLRHNLEIMGNELKKAGAAAGSATAPLQAAGQAPAQAEEQGKQE